jgi:hypothetical protein
MRGLREPGTGQRFRLLASRDGSKQPSDPSSYRHCQAPQKVTRIAPPPVPPVHLLERFECPARLIGPLKRTRGLASFRRGEEGICLKLRNL